MAARFSFRGAGAIMHMRDIAGVWGVNLVAALLYVLMVAPLIQP